MDEKIICYWSTVRNIDILNVDIAKRRIQKVSIDDFLLSLKLNSSHVTCTESGWSIGVLLSDAEFQSYFLSPSSKLISFWLQRYTARLK